eukprot:15223085-Alexandrium_andersonii.AAC.1
MTKTRSKGFGQQGPLRAQNIFVKEIGQDHANKAYILLGNCTMAARVTFVGAGLRQQRCSVTGGHVHMCKPARVPG